MRYNSWTLFLFIVLLGGFLRLWDIGTIPQWDYDEGVNINIAWNLIHGTFLWFNLKYTFIPHPPLFFIISGGLLKIFGYELIVLRALTAFYGILTTIFLYRIGTEFLDERIGLLMSFLFAIYPNAIFFGRIGFANNQLMFLSIITIYLFLKYIKERKLKWLYISSIAAGLAAVTEAWGITIVLSALLLVLVFDRRKVLRVLFISLTPLALFVISMLAIAPDAFIHDISFQPERLNNFEGVSLNPFIGIGIFLLAFFCLLCYASREKLKEIFSNIVLFIKSTIYPSIDQKTRDNIMRDNLILILFSLNLFSAINVFKPLSSTSMFLGIPDYFLLGFIGLFLIPNERVRNILLIFLAPQILFFLKIQRSDHMVLPLYPFLAIGMACVLYIIYSGIKSSERLKLLYVPVVLLLLIPLIALIYFDVSAFTTGQGVTKENPSERMMVADYVNRNTNKTDVVISDPHTARLLKASATEYVIAYSYDQRKYLYMYSYLKSDRYTFNSSYRNAKFFVTDEDVNNLKEDKYNDVRDILDDIASWPYEQIGNYYAYRNPEKRS